MDKCHEQELKAHETTDNRPEYQRPDLMTYTSDDLEEKIGPALTGSGV